MYSRPADAIWYFQVLNVLSGCILVWLVRCQEVVSWQICLIKHSKHCSSTIFTFRSLAGTTCLVSDCLMLKVIDHDVTIYWWQTINDNKPEKKTMLLARNYYSGQHNQKNAFAWTFPCIEISSAWYSPACVQTRPSSCGSSNVNPQC